MHGVDPYVFTSHALARLYATDRELWKQSLGELRELLPRVDRRDQELSLQNRIMLADTWRLIGDERRARQRLGALELQIDLSQPNRVRILEAMT